VRALSAGRSQSLCLTQCDDDVRAADVDALQCLPQGYAIISQCWRAAACQMLSFELCPDSRDLTLGMRRADGPTAAEEQPSEGRALPAQRRGARCLDAASQIVLHIQVLPAMPKSPTAPVRMRSNQAVQADASEAPQAALPIAVGTQTEECAGLESHMLVVDDSSTPLSKEELDEHVLEEEESQKEDLVAGSEGARSLEVQVCGRSLWCLRCSLCVASQWLDRLSSSVARCSWSTSSCRAVLCSSSVCRHQAINDKSLLCRGWSRVRGTPVAMGRASRRGAQRGPEQHETGHLAWCGPQVASCGLLAARSRAAQDEAMSMTEVVFDL
jgi:hypothetical protein